jgi:hypothetical protein
VGITEGEASRFNSDLIVDPIVEPLLAAEVPFGRFHGNVTQKELDLLQLAAGRVAYPAGSVWKHAAAGSRAVERC